MFARNKIYRVGVRNNELLKQKILRYSTNYLYSKIPQIVNTISVMPLIVAVAFWDKVGAGKLIVWTISAMLISLVRYWLAWRYKLLPKDHHEHRRWMQYFIMTSVCSGVIWGCAGVGLFDTAGVLEQVLLYGAIIGLSAGCVVIASYCIGACFGFAIPAIGMSAVYMLFRHDFESVALAGMLMAYFLVISKAAVNQKEDTVQAMCLLFENVDLIEQLKLQKAVAEKADADKSRFLATASHDLRQPLHAMQLYLASIDTQLNLLNQPQAWLGLQRSISSLQGLFNSLLDLSRLDAGMLQPQWREFSMKDLVEGFIGEYVTQASQKGLAFILPEQDVVVRSDSALLETIIRNLVSNAVRYTDEGCVELRWRVVTVGVSETKVLLAVKDSGMGIATNYQQDVFDEYFQIDNPERDKNKGLGLGLAIVKRLAKLLQCEISLSSVLGEGTTFYLTIPIGKEAQPLVRTSLENPVTKEFNGYTVWVIDDETLVREAMQHLLLRWGCEVLTFEGYSGAIQHWRAFPNVPSMLIADYRLRNHENGAQVLKQLLIEFGITIPCLIVTGDTSAERLSEAKSYDFPLMHKPINETRLRVFMRQSFSSTSLPSDGEDSLDQVRSPLS